MLLKKDGIFCDEIIDFKLIKFYFLAFLNDFVVSKKKMMLSYFIKNRKNKTTFV